MAVPTDDAFEQLQSHGPLDPAEMLCDEGNLNIVLPQSPKDMCKDLGYSQGEIEVMIDYWEMKEKES